MAVWHRPLSLSLFGWILVSYFFILSEADKCFHCGCVLRMQIPLKPLLEKRDLRSLHRPRCDAFTPPTSCRRLKSALRPAAVPAGPDGRPIHTYRQQHLWSRGGFKCGEARRSQAQSVAGNKTFAEHVFTSWEYVRRGSESLPDVSRGTSADKRHGELR